MGREASSLNPQAHRLRCQCSLHLSRGSRAWPSSPERRPLAPVSSQQSPTKLTLTEHLYVSVSILSLLHALSSFLHDKIKQMKRPRQRQVCFGLRQRSHHLPSAGFASSQTKAIHCQQMSGKTYSSWILEKEHTQPQPQDTALHRPA